jgi:nitronate monooxygenase
LAQQRKRKIPVLAAGGIVDGSGLVAALGLGADGVVLGTRLWASEEATGSRADKNALVDAKSCDDVVRTEVFDMINNSYKSIKWPAPYDSSGVLRNEITKEWDHRLSELKTQLTNPSNGLNVARVLQKAVDGRHVGSSFVYCGQGVGEISAIEPAYDIVSKIEKDAAATLSKLLSVFVPHDDSLLVES